MTINIYVAEDQPDQAKQLVQSVKNYSLFSQWEMKIAGVSATGEDLLRKIDRSNQWNIYFIDINLADDSELQNGFSVAQKIRCFDPLGFIIFITIRSELSFLTFQYRVQALDFIIKDATMNIDERVHSCLATVEERLNLLQNGQTISLSTENGKQSFMVNDILYLAANKGHILSLFTQQKEYSIYQETLNELETRLDQPFIRCHRSFLINGQAITHVAKDFRSLILKDGSHIPVSVRKKGEVKKTLNTVPARLKVRLSAD